MKSRKSGSALLWVILGMFFGAAAWFFLGTRHSVTVPLPLPTATAVQTWTPEQIQSNPVGYLSWALNETTRTESRLITAAANIRAKIDQARRTQSVNDAARADKLRLLEDAKQAYRQASIAQQWPAPLRGESLKEAELKTRILDAASQSEALGSMNSSLADAAQALQRKLSETEQQLLDLRKLRVKLGADLEIARLRDSSDELLALSTDLSSILGAAGALSQPLGDLSLDDLIPAAADRKAEDDFQTLMAE